MKKTLLSILLLLVASLSSKAFDFSAVCSTGQTLYYNINGTNVTVTSPENNINSGWSGYSKPTGNLIIPSSVTNNGTTYSVTSIRAYAFKSCTGLTSVTIPNSVTSIGDDAFYGCSGLAGTLTIPNSVTSIGEGAFHGCSGLTGTLTIPNSVTSIGANVFEYCTGLTSVTIPNSVISIGAYAFYGCSGLTGALAIPNTVTSIGANAFRSCTGLTSVTIPNSVVSIGAYAFVDCSSLTSIVVENGNTIYDSRNNCNAIIETSTNTLLLGCMNTTIPNSVTTIGDWAFDKCTGLTSVTISNSVTSIGRYAFCGCTGLTSITIPNSVTAIGNYAFSGCSGLTGALTIPNSVTSIGNSVFYGCTGLTSITIPNTVTSIGNEAFSNCSGLTTINFNATNCTCEVTAEVFSGCTSLITLNIGNNVQIIPAGLFYHCTGLTSVTIPNSVTSIGDDAFYGCSGLTGALTIPNSVTSIGANAFRSCTGLTSITIGNSVISIGSSAFYNSSSLTEIYSLNNVAPTLGSDAFSSVTSTIPVHIPCGALASYYSRWSYFSNFIEESPASFSAVSADPTKGAVQILTMPTCTNPQAVVYASPNSGYQFDHWSNGSTANPLTLTVTEDLELIAYFSPVGSQPTTNYTITVVSNDPAMGSVTGGGSYAAGSTATLTATANSGYHFVQWHDGNTQASRSITVTGDSTYTAYFAANAENEYTITVIPQNPTMGSTTGSGTFPYGTQTTITAEPNPGYLFVQWQDGNTDDFRTITVTGDATYTAYFRANNGIDDISADDIKIYVNGRNIVIEGSLDESVMVYDVMGRTIYHDVVRAPITAPAAGVYMVKIGNAKARKVVILR